MGPTRRRTREDTGEIEGSWAWAVDEKGRWGTRPRAHANQSQDAKGVFFLE